MEASKQSSQRSQWGPPSSTSAYQHPKGPALFFWISDGPNGFCCQWYLGNFTDPKSGLTFNCAEQWMMWNKDKMAGDAAAMRDIMKTKSPKLQKSLGRGVTNFDSARWDEIKYDVVVEGNRLKFSQNAHLKAALLGTGDRYICEGSPFDRIWGVGYKAAEARQRPRTQWGENLLGRALCAVREELKAG